jgi:hypothetical protein
VASAEVGKSTKCYKAKKKRGSYFVQYACRVDESVAEMFESEYSNSGGTKTEVDPDSVEVRGKKGKGGKAYKNMTKCRSL